MRGECWNIEPRMWERSARMFSIGDNVGIGKPAIWSRRTFEYTCVVYILAVNGPSSSRRVTPPLRAYTFIIRTCGSRLIVCMDTSAAHGGPWYIACNSTLLPMTMMVTERFPAVTAADGYHFLTAALDDKLHGCL